MHRSIVAIHQPNFFPWLGYFNKIARADTFCVLDNVQFPKTGGTWTNRVRLMVGGKPAWITVPVVRSYHGTRSIDQMRISPDPHWRTKLMKTLRGNYGRGPYFKQVFPLLETLIQNPTESLARYNENATAQLSAALGLDRTKFVRVSTLETTGEATDRLISIVREVHGTAYLCGGGAGGYQEDDKFAAAGIELIHQDFQPPIYPQPSKSEFVAGLSVIDALMNCGFEETAQLVREQGCQVH